MKTAITDKIARFRRSDGGEWHEMKSGEKKESTASFPLLFLLSWLFFSCLLLFAPSLLSKPLEKAIVKAATNAVN